MAGGQIKPGTQSVRTSKGVELSTKAACYATVKALVGILTMGWGHLGGAPKDVSTLGAVVSNATMTIHI